MIASKMALRWSAQGQVAAAPGDACRPAYLGAGPVAANEPAGPHAAAVVQHGRDPGAVLRPRLQAHAEPELRDPRDDHAQAPLEGRLVEQGQAAVSGRPCREGQLTDGPAVGPDEAHADVGERTHEQPRVDQGQQVLHLVIGGHGPGQRVGLRVPLDDQHRQAQRAEPRRQHRTDRAAPGDQDVDPCLRRAGGRRGSGRGGGRCG